MFAKKSNRLHIQNPSIINDLVRSIIPNKLFLNMPVKQNAAPNT